MKQFIVHVVQILYCITSIILCDVIKVDISIFLLTNHQNITLKGKLGTGFKET